MREMHDAMKLRHTCLSLEGKAYEWWMFYKIHQPPKSWTEFENAFCKEVLLSNEKQWNWKAWDKCMASTFESIMRHYHALCSYGFGSLFSGCQELRWYKDAVFDCIMRNIIGCGDLWPLVVQTAISLVLCIEGSNPRSKWYRNILNEMLGELERHRLDATYYRVWMENVDRLLEAMGLVVVAHLKRLLTLLFPWLHTADDSLTLLALNLLKVIVKYTWPRMPFYAERFWKELTKVYNDSFDKKQGPEIRSSILDTALLIQMSGGSAFELVWRNGEDNPTSLASLLAHHLSRQREELVENL
ncbi:hypothetical protein L7F22_048885 [Adiantum nelumboides]|nr:hypothetical protein [Adiantum nelumboides]